MAITILNEKIYANGVEYETPIVSSSGVVHVAAGLHGSETRYVVMYTCHTDVPLNQLSLSIRLAGVDGTGSNGWLGMYVTTSMHDEHLTTSVGGDTYIRFGYTYTNCNNQTLNSNNGTYAVGVVRKIIPAGTFYVYIVQASYRAITYSTWYSQSSDVYAPVFTGVEAGADEVIESHLVFINTDDVVFYMNGVSGVSKVVGFDGDGNGNLVPRVVRYKFTTPISGTNKVSAIFYFAGMYSSATTYYVPLRFFIGTDPESHVNADATYAYTGELTMLEGNLTLVGEADIVLLPNTTYYLWVFPGADKKYSCYNWDWNAIYGRTYLELLGAAGVFYIDNGQSFDIYQCYVDNGNGWDLCIPYIDNGQSWDLYS